LGTDKLVVAQSGMNLPDNSCPIRDEPRQFPGGINLLDGSCPLRMSRKDGSCPIRDDPFRWAVPQSGMILRDFSEVNTCVIVLEWGLPSAEHTSESLRVKGAFQPWS